MDISEDEHRFDLATKLTWDKGIYRGRTSKFYENMIGPYGGITTATLLRAVMEHPKRIGEPISITINFAAPVVNGEFIIIAKPTRTNRSTQHWFIKLIQDDETAITGTAVFGIRKETWSMTTIEFPTVPAPNTVPSISTKGLPKYMSNYDIKIVEGFIDLTSMNPMDDKEYVTIQWIRDKPKRALDILSLASICDSCSPGIIIRESEILPVYDTLKLNHCRT